MSFNYGEKVLIIKTNEFNFIVKKDKINLISIGKSNLQNYKNIGKKYYKLYYERINDFHNEMKLFGNKFIKNNNKLRIISNNKESEIKEYLITNGKIKKVKNISYMFSDCKSLNYLPDISKWNTKNVTNMSYMFYNCESLNSLPDISK